MANCFWSLKKRLIFRRGSHYCYGTVLLQLCHINCVLFSLLWWEDTCIGAWQREEEEAAANSWFIYSLVPSDHQPMGKRNWDINFLLVCDSSASSLPGVCRLHGIYHVFTMSQVSRRSPPEIQKLHWLSGNVEPGRLLLAFSKSASWVVALFVQRAGSFVLSRKQG